MNDSKDPPGELLDSTNPSPKLEASRIDTPGNGTNSYNNSLSAPTTLPDGSCKQALPAADPLAPVQPASADSHPVIPGLGLVNSSNNQPTSEPSAEHAAQQTPSKTLEHDAVRQETAHTTATEEQQPQAQAEDVGRDAMEVDEVAGHGNEPSSAQGAMNQDGGDNPEWEVDSSPYESSSDSSTSSDSDDSDESDDDSFHRLTREEQARLLMQVEVSDDEGEEGASGGQVRSANEMAEEALPIPDVTVTPEMEIAYLGKVQNVVDNFVLIAANTSGEYQVLQQGSLLCFEDRKVAGVVADLIGQVEHPFYTVTFPTPDDARQSGLSVGTPVYYVVAHSTFVFTQPLKGMKGSDASNLHDEEVAEDDVEFSDDEAEAEYKRKLKQKRNEKKAGRSKKGPPGPSNLGRSVYGTDGSGDGYNRLSRPKNYHEMMEKSEAPVEGSERGPSTRGGYGRGRGSDRGRGGHGRDSRGDSRRESHQSHQQPDAFQELQPPAFQPHVAYGQPAYPQQQPGLVMPPFPQWPQQQPAQYPAAPAQAPQPFPFQFPFQQMLGQQNFPSIPLGAHVNPMFLAMQQFQQHQQQQQQFQQAQQWSAAQAQNQAKPEQDQQPNLNKSN
ncbi:hypothetical protein N7468_002430 [Penicillium chermesinum]|uniref:H/ACA ribonucleoprotein complex non-core subunit NAF1 n=1 Tax=Penicillium chermesinum TaxID=63820 RepID=A0A9W9TXZ4_9EURO|nr:uncharacterized protein N7468_002430 [Penicillium chermesinum]KAJ5247447.1 hypothetical protein N7468_002430 [Penicillium chermesinum]KAJ6145685.1 hypothetical protein N7470_009580 [Penicillium chermesinum]